MVILLISVLFAGLATVPTAAQTAPGWNTTTVDSSVGVPTLTQTSIALDANGNPHISYLNDSGSGSLKYASFNSTAWNITTVDTNLGEAGGYTSLALDAQGNPHISYYDNTNSGLRYASFNGTAWNTTTVAPIFGVWYTSLALDTAGNPHISYYANEELEYASFNGTAWSITTADSTGSGMPGLGMYNSLALDASGNPHISYIDADHNLLKYASFNGTAWNITTVDTNGGAYTSLALDASGNPHISYWGSGGLNYASFNGTAWNITTVDNIGYGSTSLALDTAGNPHISYFDGANNTLKYASFNGTAWNITAVDPNLGEYGGATSIALDASGNPYISYLNDSGSGSLKYASLTPVSTALNATVSPTTAAINQPFWVNGTLNTTDGTPIANATITLQNSTDNATWNNVTTNVTDASGNYQFSKSVPAAGTYYYRTYYDGNAQYGNATSNTVNVTVAPLSTTLNATAPTTAYVNQNFTINGTLNATSGIPVAGATIQLQKNVSGTWTNVTGKTNTTTSIGAYSISTSEPAAGTYQYRTYYAGNDTLANATSNVVKVSVTAPATTGNLLLNTHLVSTTTGSPPKMVTTYTFSGQLMTTSWTPVANAAITLQSSSDKVHWSAFASPVKTNAQGAYTFKGTLKPGSYYFRTFFAGTSSTGPTASRIVKVVLSSNGSSSVSTVVA